MRTSRQLQQGLSGLQRALTTQPARPLTSFSRSLYSRSIRSALSRRQPLPLRSPISIRYNSSSAESPLTDRGPLSEEEKAQIEERRQNEPAYQITFTCKPCQHRSSHRISKHGYHKGTVLIKCPGCESRHVISDHMKIFMDTSTTLEDLLKEKGQNLKKGTVDGDMEFWDDGTVTQQRVEKPKTGAEAELGSGDEKPSS